MELVMGGVLIAGNVWMLVIHATTALTFREMNRPIPIPNLVFIICHIAVITALIWVL